MSSSARSTWIGPVLPAVVTALALMTSGGGIGLPGIGDDDSTTCGVTSSDPRSHDSCNHNGHNGTDGQDGAVHHHH